MPLTDEEIWTCLTKLAAIFGLVSGQKDREIFLTFQACLCEGTNEAFEHLIDLLKKRDNLLASKGELNCELLFMIAELECLKA